MTKMALKGRLALLQRHLDAHKATLFAKQHRDGKRRRKFDLGGSFKVGLGSTQPGHLRHLANEQPGFKRHNFKNTAVYVKPVHEQKLTREAKRAYEMASDILNMVDPDYAAGEYLVQFAHMCSDEHRVEKHVDGEDISYQYAVSLGDYMGATLRSYGEKGFTDLDNHNKIAKFDGRLPHEVIKNNFSGNRFTVIWYKNYDHRKTQADPILRTPSFV